MAKTPNSNTFEMQSAPDIYHNIIRMMVYLHRDFDPARAWKGLPREPSFPQFKALMTLRHLGPCTLKKLASALGVSSASASEMVERLVDLDLVDRQQDPRDRRKIQIGLTRMAVKRVARQESMIYKRLQQLMQQMGPEKTGKWVEISECLSELFDKINSGYTDSS
jgi:DNA-binding MarR family transcriptional regulator